MASSRPLLCRLPLRRSAGVGSEGSPAARGGLGSTRQCVAVVVAYVTLFMCRESQLASRCQLTCRDGGAVCAVQNAVVAENEGGVVIWLLVEAVKELCEKSDSGDDADEDKEDADATAAADSGSGAGSGAGSAAPPPTVPVPHIHSAEPFTDRKSAFQGHVAAVSSTEEVRAVLATLLSDKKIARATHNMYAYTFVDAGRDVVVRDNDDDGETAAGRRMAHLLAVLGVQNVLVVVTRWYGGVKLGPDRFKHINNAARSVLDEAGFLAAVDGGDGTAGGGGKGSGGKKGRRR